MYCSRCGTNLADGVKFCPSCGAPVSGSAAQPESFAQQPEAPQPDARQNSVEPNFTQPDYTQTNYTRPNYTQPNAPQMYDCGIQKRDVALAIILSIVTCGIYSIFWFIKQVDDVNRAANDQSAYSGGITFLLGAVTCGIYSLYWYYQAGKKITYAEQVRGMPLKENLEILYLLLGLFGFGIVSMALIQKELNDMALPDA